MQPVKMLAILLGLARSSKAALIIGLFHALEVRSVADEWLTMCFVVACLILMTIFFFPDASVLSTWE